MWCQVGVYEKYEKKRSESLLSLRDVRGQLKEADKRADGSGCRTSINSGKVKHEREKSVSDCGPNEAP